MNSKSLLLAVFAACVLLGYGPVASAETETAKRTEPTDTTEKEESGQIAGSWTSGAPSPEVDTKAERRAGEQVVDDLDTVLPSATTPSPGQAQADNSSRNASDRCLVSTVAAVLADRTGRDSGLAIDAQDGVVSLAGTLPDLASIEKIGTVVAGIKGVSRVDTTGLTTSSRADPDQE